MNMCINHQADPGHSHGVIGSTLNREAQKQANNLAGMTVEEALARVNHDYQPATGIEGRDYQHEVKPTTAYGMLYNVLSRAYAQAANGKGAERHANGKAFEDQPMQDLISLYGVGFALGQAAKKAQESQRMAKDAAVRELLGSIVYIAGAIIALEAA